MRSAGSVKTFASLSLAATLAFSIVVFSESFVSRTARRTDEVRVELLRIRAAMLRARGAADLSSETERLLNEYHLRSPAAEQCAALIFNVERISAKNSVEVLSLRRGTAIPDRGQAAADSYELTIRGTYPHALLSLLEISQADLITTIKGVTFERMATDPRPVVRASIELQVYRMNGRDVPSRRS